MKPVCVSQKCLDVSFFFMRIGNWSCFQLAENLRPYPRTGKFGSLHIARASGRGSRGSKVPLTATVPREHPSSFGEARELRLFRLHWRQRRQPISVLGNELQRSTSEL